MYVRGNPWESRCGGDCLCYYVESLPSVAHSQDCRVALDAREDGMDVEAAEAGGAEGLELRG